MYYDVVRYKRSVQGVDKVRMRGWASKYYVGTSSIGETRSMCNTSHSSSAESCKAQRIGLLSLFLVNTLLSGQVMLIVSEGLVYEEGFSSLGETIRHA